MDRCLYWIMALWAIFIEGSRAACSYPGDLPDTTVISLTVKSSYEVDDIVLYECEKLGAGHVVIRCMANDTWSDPSRSCDSIQVWDNGALAGVVVAAFNYFIALVVVIYAKKTFPNAESAGRDPKIKEMANQAKKQAKQEPVTSKGLQ